MFSAALIVFREVLEIAIVLSVVLVATRGISGRTLWTWIGIGLGIFGSVLVAYFINEISALAEGMGQEIFNALIMLTAAAVIGWTVLWMRAHAKHMTDKIKLLGKKITDGDVHLFSVSIVIALAFLREGSEIVLFGNGILLSGKTSLAELLTGAGIGLAGGTAVGWLMYVGLIRISTKYIFKVTSWLLIFLAAGMASNAAGYFVQAGVFEHFTGTIWDSSALVADGSIMGKVLNTLVGYTAAPSGIQLIFYAVTLGALAFGSARIEKKLSKQAKRKI